MVKLKDYRFSYTFLALTILLFSYSFSSYRYPLITTVTFLLLVNFTCFTNEYLVIKYNQRYKRKKSNKGYLLFVPIQILFTILVFVAFKFYLT